MNNNKCRFNYPLPISNKTIILSEDEIGAKNNKFVILKRKENEVRVNNYNQKLLELWEGNQDIQPIGSMYGVSFYATKYASKEEPAEINQSLQNAIREASNEQFADRIRYATSRIMKNRERSAQEAAFVICL